MQGANRPADLLQDNELSAVLKVRGQFDNAADASHPEAQLPPW